MKPSLQLKLSQHLALTPQLQQSIRLLQLSTLELEQELEKFLQENPLLEREEIEYAAPQASTTSTSEGETASTEKSEAEPEPPSSSAEDESWLGEESSYSSSAGTFDDDENDIYQDVQAATTSLREHLSWQLGLMSIPDRDRTLVQ